MPECSRTPDLRAAWVPTLIADRIKYAVNHKELVLRMGLSISGSVTVNYHTLEHPAYAPVHFGIRDAILYYIHRHGS